MKYLIPFLFSLQLLAATSLSVTYDSVTKTVAPSNLVLVAPLTATAPTTGNSVVNKTALDAAIAAGVASKLNTTNGVAFGLTSATLSSLAPASVVTRSYLDHVAVTNLTAWLSITTWGDSLTAGDGSSASTNRYPAALGRYSGFIVSNGGVSGQTSTQIRTRQTAGSNTWTSPTIIWAGRNNFTDTNAVLADVAAMVANMATYGNTNRYLVMSVINANNATEWVGTTSYNTITNLNGALSAAYGANYLDIRSYLVSQYNPLNAQDVIDHNHDCLPSSLQSGDGIHLLDAGYLAVADHIFTNKLATLRGSWSSVTTPAEVIGQMRSPGPIGDVTPNTGRFTTLTATGAASVNTLDINATYPILSITENDQASTNSSWTLIAENKELSLRIPDNLGGNNAFMTFARDGGTAGEAVIYGTGLTLVGNISANGIDNKLRALHSASAGTYFPTFTSDPSAIYQTVKNRTAAEVRSDIGAGTGSVTSVSATVPAFLSVAGSPITTNGTLAISYSGTALPIANGGTGRTSLGTGVDTANGLAMSGTGGFVGYTSPTMGSPSADTLSLSAANPILFFNETDQASTNSAWRLNVDAKTLSLRIPDNLGGNSPFITFTRDGGVAGATVLYGSGLTLVGDIIANGVNSSLRASAAGSAGTYFPVWTADPSGVYQVIKNRTAAQVRSDIGAVSRTSAVIGANGVSVTRLRHGRASAMASGTVTVADAYVTANTRIILTVYTPGGTRGFLDAGTRTASTSFTITSSSVLDTSVVDWVAFEP
jgi:lysophospholipase L1-like esterase